MDRLGTGHLRGLRHRKREEEDAPASEDALDPDVSAVRLDDPAGDLQSQPRAGTFALLRLPEAVEDLGQPYRRDAAARVGDPEQDVAVACRRADGDASMSRRELDRVADQVLEDLIETVLI